MKKDLSNLDRDIMQPISRDIDDAFSDGIDCDVKIMGGNALYLYDETDALYNAIYTDAAGSLVIPTTTSATYNNDTALYFGTDSDVGLNWISATPYFYLSCLADGTDLRIGNGTLSFDILWYGSAAGNLVTFSSTGDDITLNGMDLSLEDDDYLYLGDENDVSMAWDDQFDIVPAADAAAMILGDATHGWTITAYGGTTSQSVVFTGGTTNTVVFDDMDLYLGDNDILGFGDATSPGDVYMRWDETDFDILAAADGTVFKFGNGTLDFDIWWYAGSNTIVFDEGNSDVTFNGVSLSLEDSDHLYLGDDNDVTIAWDGTDLDIIPALDGSDMYLGTSAAAWDITWYGESASYSVVFGSTGNTVTFNAVDLVLGDEDQIILGDGSDVVIDWDGAELNIVPVADNTDIIIGSTGGTKSFDIDIYGEDADHHLKWVADSSELDITGTVEMQSTNKIQFSTTGNYIQASTGSQLDIVADTTLALSGAVTTDGIVTFGAYEVVFGTTGTSSTERALWYDNTTNKLMFYNGTAIETITSTT